MKINDDRACACACVPDFEFVAARLSCASPDNARRCVASRLLGPPPLVSAPYVIDDENSLVPYDASPKLAPTSSCVNTLRPSIEDARAFVRGETRRHAAEAERRRYMLITTLCSYVHLYLSQRIQPIRFTVELSLRASRRIPRSILSFQSARRGDLPPHSPSPPWNMSRVFGTRSIHPKMRGL